MALSLEKKQEIVRIQLAKNNIPEGLIMQVKMQLDVSSSFEGAFRRGTINELVNRLIPLAMRFDDNGSLEAYAFSTRAVKTRDITAADFDSYVNNKFLKDAGSILWNGTNYAPALKLLADDIKPSAVASAKSFLGKLFSTKKNEPAPSSDVPNFVMFITDGDCFDETEAERQLEQFAESKTYIQFIGVGHGFNFLKRMASRFPHVGFVNFTNLDNTPDQEMYEQLLDKKLCAWIKSQ